MNETLAAIMDSIATDANIYGFFMYIDLLYMLLTFEVTKTDYPAVQAGASAALAAFADMIISYNHMTYFPEIIGEISVIIFNNAGYQISVY